MMLCFNGKRDFFPLLLINKIKLIIEQDGINEQGGNVCKN